MSFEKKYIPVELPRPVLKNYYYQVIDASDKFYDPIALTVYDKTAYAIACIPEIKAFLEEFVKSSMSLIDVIPKEMRTKAKDLLTRMEAGKPRPK